MKHLVERQKNPMEIEDENIEPEPIVPEPVDNLDNLVSKDMDD